MKILLATPLYPPDIGGPATYSKLLADELSKRGYKIEILSFGEVRNLPVIIRHIVYFFKILRRAKDTHIIYALDPVSVGLPAALASFFLTKRFFVRIAGDYAWEQGVQRFKVRDHLDVFSKKNGDYLIPVLILKKLQKSVAQSAKAIIVPSEYFKGVIMNWGIEAKKIKTIYSVADDIPFQGRKSDLRDMLKFNGKIVMSAGRLVPWKGFEALVSLVPELTRRYSSFKLFIAGDGPEMKKLSEMISKKKLDNHVALAGPLKKDVLFKYIRVADVFVLNTDYEGLSHQLLEVMSIGTPIVTTFVGGNPELIENKKNGILVTFNNKNELYESIVSILDNPEHGERLAMNAKETLKKFSKEKMLAELVKVLK